MILVNAVFWFIIAFLFALVEIEIEGKYGWSEKTNTWYKKKGLAAKIWGLFLNGRPITGYHLFMFALFLLLLHSAFFLDLSWNLINELGVLSIYFVLIALEDFLWFVFNPDYTIKNYKKEKIWWFSKSYWIFGLFPIDYLISILASLILAYLAGIFVYQLELIGILLVFIFIAILLAPSYHRFYKNIRKRDDRKISGIFH